MLFVKHLINLLKLGFSQQYQDQSLQYVTPYCSVDSHQHFRDMLPSSSVKNSQEFKHITFLLQPQ